MEDEFNFTDDDQGLNDVVTLMGIDLKIATNRLNKGVIPSDHTMQAREIYVLKYFVTRKGLMQFDDMYDWGNPNFLQYYMSHMTDDNGKILPAFRLSIKEEKTLFLEFGDNPAVNNCLEYRWNNGYAFLRYKDRVDLWLNRHVIELGQEVNERMLKIKRAMKIRDQVKRDLRTVISVAEISERAKVLVEHIERNLTVTDFLNEPED